VAGDGFDEFVRPERTLDFRRPVRTDCTGTSAPAGAAERFDNSPAIYGWVSRQPKITVPRGTAENLVAVRKHLSSLAGLWTMAGNESQP